jgi:hypothetical protein
MGTKMHIDVKGLQKFNKQMNKLNEVQIKQFCESALKELAARLLRDAKFRTPVGDYPASSGKMGGTLRNAWTIGKVYKEGKTFKIEVINPTEYAPYVEFGHRTPNHTGWVDGYFMLTISELELEKDAPGILMNKLNKFLNEVLTIA